jgi:hypothetical protein
VNGKLDMKLVDLLRVMERQIIQLSHKVVGVCRGTLWPPLVSGTPPFPPPPRRIAGYVSDGFKNLPVFFLDSLWLELNLIEFEVRLCRHPAV